MLLRVSFGTAMMEDAMSERECALRTFVRVQKGGASLAYHRGDVDIADGWKGRSCMFAISCLLENGV